MKMRLRTNGCPNFCAAALPCGAFLLVSILPVEAGEEHSLSRLGIAARRDNAAVSVAPAEGSARPAAITRVPGEAAPLPAASIIAVGRGQLLSPEDVASPPPADASGSPVILLGADAPPRPDLLAPVPEDYARILIDAARHERVDINLMLAILHCENAAFDPAAVSPAGAVGLMQLMPATGRALGAADLTLPAQNIRAAARFLKILAKKYRNPVLIASAYHAGEPQVDAGRSLPLIRETAAYVTRVIGLYTGTHQAERDIRSARREAAAPRAGASRRGRISSLMLIYSDTGLLLPEAQPVLPAGSAGRPARMLKEKP